MILFKPDHHDETLKQDTLKQSWDAQNNFDYPIKTKILGGVETLVTFAEAENPVATLHFVKGFKSSPELYKEFLDDMVSKGINVVLVTLPDPYEEVDFFEEYEFIAEAVYLGGELDYLTDPDLPRIAANHSTGGFLLTKLLSSEIEAEVFNERYDGSAYVAPFYGSRYHRASYLGPLATLYSYLAGDRLVGTTWLERQFYKAAANDNEEEEKMVANHRQALYMDRPTRRLMNDIRKNGMPDAVMEKPSKFFLSMNDQVSYNVLATEVAREMGANIKLLDGSHSHVRQTQNGRDALSDFVLDVADEVMLERKWKNVPLTFKSSRSGSPSPDPA